MSGHDPPQHLMDVLALDRAGLRARPGLPARLWGALLDGGDDAGVEREARRALDEARAAEDRAGAVEACALGALALWAQGRAGEALERAREAWRLAQEQLRPEPQFLASIVLARMRRASGRPHMALHILAQLGRVASPAWRPWMAWETLLAGGTELADEWLHGAPAAHALAEILRAARSGDRAPFAAAAARLAAAPGDAALFAREARALRLALDPDAVPSAADPPALVEWLHGRDAGAQAPLPISLFGVGARDRGPAGGEAKPAAAVLARPGAPARRVLWPGVSLVPDARVIDREPESAGMGAGARVEAGLAVLALAGPAGITRDAFFQAVYRFRFVGERHRGVLEVLIHRMRACLGESASIDRDGGHLAFRPAGPLALADPRCALPMADRLVRALVELGTPSAADAARALGLRLRTVQAALQQLVADGTCRVEKHGRSVRYRVEDTTFTLSDVASALKQEG